MSIRAIAAPQQRTAMRWTVETLTSAEPAVFEEVYELSMKICDKYGYPSVECDGDR